jgi:undecaprenyl-diphosphatase
VSFISALLVTKLLLRFVSQHSVRVLRWYRIVFGAVILITAWTGVVHW